jgi:hypothetical protein
MTKYDHLIAMLFLIMVGTTVTIKMISLATTSAAAMHAVTIASHPVLIGH